MEAIQAKQRCKFNDHDLDMAELKVLESMHMHGPIVLEALYECWPQCRYMLSRS